MKYLNKILLFSLLVFTFACDKDDPMDPVPGEEDPVEMTPEETAEARLSNDSGWTITDIETNFDVISDELEEYNTSLEVLLLVGLFDALDMRLEATAACETDDVIKFSDDSNIDYSEGADTCSADGTTQYEVFFENGTWDLKDVNTLTITTSFEGETEIIDYNIDDLTDTNLVLSSSIDANEEAEISTSDFQFTNTLDTKITMTKAN